MQSRYLGSDALSQRQLQAQQEAADANSLAVQRIQKGSSQAVESLLQGQEQVGKMQLQLATAQAQASQNNMWTGFTQAVQQGAEAYTNYKNQEARREEAQKQAQAKALEDLQKQQAEREYVAATDDLGKLTGSYVRDTWNQGTLNYRAEAAKLIAKYPGLDNAKRAELIDRANTTALGRDEEVRKNYEAEQQKLANQQAESVKQAAMLSFITDIKRLKELPPTEQARPLLEKFNTRLDKFLGENNGLTFEQKMGVVNSISQEILKAYEGKSESFAAWEAGMKARATWAVGYQQLYANYMQNRDESAFKDGKLLLTLQTGRDYSQYMAQPGEAEANALRIGQAAVQLQDLSDQTAERTGTRFQYSSNTSRMIAAGILTIPNFREQFESNPLFAKNPAIKEGIALAQRLTKARTQMAELGIQNAQTQAELTKLDLTNINNFSSVTRSIIQRESSGQALTPEQALYKRILTDANDKSGGALAGIIATLDSANGRALTKEELASIQQTLQNQAAGIRNAQQAEAAVQTQRINKFNQEYDDIIKVFGGIPSDEQLNQFFKQGEQTLTDELSRAKQAAEASAQQILSPAYGRQSNFNQASQGVAAFGSPDGKVRIAPRTAVMVQTQNADGGAPWITPIQAGVNTRHTFNRGEMGGGYGAGRQGGKRKHAGIDFGLKPGQNAVAVVSGTVAHVGTARGYGNYIEIAGDNGYIYRYAHQKALVAVGARVQAGQAVSTPNGSGVNVGGEHLHFEVLKGQGYKPGSTYGFDKTVDPVAHLRALTPNAGGLATAPQLRGQSVAAVSSQLPWAKTTAPSLFTRGGGTLQAGLFQQVGKPTYNASQVFTPQRPLTKGQQPSSLAGGKVQNNPNESYGYSWIQQRPEFSAKLAQIADALGVPASWIADIMRQESGDNFRLANAYHTRGGNRNYGLFGFGSDSGVANYDRLNPVQQLDAYYKYMVNNGWLKHHGNTGGNVTLAQLWAMTRMGTNWRKQILNGRDPNSLKLNDTGLTYADEIKLLGKWVGRQYDVDKGTQSFRSQRNRAPGRRASSAVEQALVAVNSPDVVYRPNVN